MGPLSGTSREFLARFWCISYASNTIDIDDSDNLKTFTAQSIADLAAGGGGDVTAAGNITDNAVVRGDGGVKGVQDSTMTISDNGEMLNASQPVFLAAKNVTQTDISTGNTTISFGNEITDQGSNFASDTFTAPVTGKYQLNTNLHIVDMDSAATSYRLRIVTSNRSFHVLIEAPTLAVDGFHGLTLSTVADMDAADTAIVQVTQSGGASQTDIVGGEENYFSGFLIA